MAMSKKGFAALIDASIYEAKNIKLQSKSVAEKLYLDSEKEKIEENTEYVYSRYMGMLVSSKIGRLYAILSSPAHSRILSMSSEEVEEYRSEKVSEVSGEINRLMLSMEVAKSDMEKSLTKEKVEALIEEQGKLKEMSSDELKSYVIAKLGLDSSNEEVSFDGKEETIVLENICKDKDTLSNFIEMMKEHRSLEREVKSIRSEQIIIYNDLLAGNVKSDISIDDLFSEESLTSLQSKIADYLKDIVDAESNIKRDFSSKMRKAYSEIKSSDYKYSNKNDIVPYGDGVLDVFKEMIPERTYELASLQNEEWLRLNKKIFKTSEVNTKIAGLCMEIDETKGVIESCVRDWYKTNYYSNSAFGPISSRISGKFEYSLGAKNALSEFINYGTWPNESDIASLKLSVKLNKAEAEKSIIYAEQIKERLTRLYNDSLDVKKKELEKLEKKMTDLVGNWKSPVILSIINGVK